MNTQILTLSKALVVFSTTFIMQPTMATPASAAFSIDNVAGLLYGKWKGRGVIVPAAGKPSENITCRVSYARASNSAFTSHIRCAAVDFKINASGTISYSKTSKMYRGRLTDRGTGWTLVLSGGRTRKKNIRFGLKITKAKVDGWLHLNIRSRKSHTWLAQRTTSAGLKQLLKINFHR